MLKKLFELFSPAKDICPKCKGAELISRNSVTATKKVKGKESTETYIYLECPSCKANVRKNGSGKYEDCPADSWTLPR